MQRLVYMLFVAVFTLDYLTGPAHLLNGKFSLMPELLSGVAILLLVREIAISKVLSLNIKYVIFFFLFGIHLLNGLIINQVPSGAIVAGARIYFKYIPFFLIPIVYAFTDEQLSRQLKLLLLLCCMQLPVALFQRFVLGAHSVSGDVVRGTFGTSSILSIILVSAIAMLLAFYLNNRITLRTFILYASIVAVPTMINETKGTFILMPVAVGTIVLIQAWRGRLHKGVIGALISITLLLGISSMLYSTLFTQYDQGVLTFLTSKQTMLKYLAPRTAGYDKTGNHFGRIDSVVKTYKTLAKQPLGLLAGFGMGTATPSPIGRLSGSRSYQHEGLYRVSAAYQFLEIGMIGVIFSLIFFLMIFRDARHLSHYDSLIGTISLGWAGVVPIIIMSFFYKNIIPVNGIMYMFWYLSGVIVAARERMAYQDTSQHTSPTMTFPAASDGHYPLKPSRY